MPRPVEPPENAPCVVRGDVDHRGVLWQLRTRLDAIPTLRVDQASVTGWLLSGPRGSGPTAVAQVENDTMRLRARVAEEDLVVVLSRATTPLAGMVTDGITQRAVLRVEADTADVAIEVSGAGSTALYVPCAELALSPNQVSLDGVLPPARGEIVVKRSTMLRVQNSPTPVAVSRFASGAAKPEGVLGEARDDDSDPKARMMSFRACGGWLVGLVSRRDLLGPPRLQYGSNGRCPQTGTWFFELPPPRNYVMSCERDIDVFVRSATLEDPVGVLKAGAHFALDERDRDAPTTRVYLEKPPAVPLAGASFSVRTTELLTCKGAG